MTRTDPALADELVDAVRTFVAKEVMPVALELEHGDTYPAELVAGMRELGLFGCTIPPEHGGLG
ncbi:MAG: acyl-CoA dehydrogenase family protein, partial [Actinobacteria bacterium]